MNMIHIQKTALLLAVCGILPLASAQTFNVWRGGEKSVDWNDPYKWHLKHIPESGESVHFREANSVVEINSTITLDNGMLIYGRELTLQGNGVIDLPSHIPHRRTINIPAEASGASSLTLDDSLSINGRIALSAKAFGTAAGRGTFTLRNRASASGTLCIGNNGCGSGKVLVHDTAHYHITELQLKTKAKDGGSAEIHINGGSVHIDTRHNPFMPFFEDAGRKIVIGNKGTLKIETNLSQSQQVQQFKAMIQNDRIVAAPGCRLKPPALNQHTILIQGEEVGTPTTVETKQQLLAAIDERFEQQQLAEAQPAAEQSEKDPAESKLENLLQDPSPPPAETELLAVVGMLDSTEKVAENKPKTTQETNAMAGYIAFIGGALLLFRRPKKA